MQLEKVVLEIDLGGSGERDPLAREAKQQLGSKQEPDGWFPPSCERGGTME